VQELLATVAQTLIRALASPR